MDATNLDRRKFLELIAATPMLFFTPLIRASTNKNKILLMVELKGGNDALNTLVPYENSNYYKLRPKLGIEEELVLKLGNGFGMHPSMKSLLPDWQTGDMAWIQGIGYPEPNRSHFRSIEIWETASKSNQYLDSGWISQLYEKHKYPQQRTKNIQGVVVGNNAGPLNNGGKFNVMQMQNKKSFISLSKRFKSAQAHTSISALSHVLRVQNNIHKNARLVIKALEQAPSVGITFPKNKFGKLLETTSQIILGGLNAPVYKVEIGSFDTHHGQAIRHTRLLTQLSEGLTAFSAAMKKAGMWDDVLIVTYSEFGRRVNENASGGTDHGTAAAHFALGGRVKGGINNGLIGTAPSLSQLDENDLRYTTDFRSYYHTIASQWLGVNSPWANHGVLPLID